MYAQILDDLRLKITHGEIPVHGKLPTEMELTAMFGVSRITAKRALVELEQEGKVYRIPGKGTFVAEAMDSKSAHHHSHQLIALLFPFSTSSIPIMQAIKQATTTLSAHGVFLSVHDTGMSVEKEKVALHQLRDSQVAGLLWYPMTSIQHLELIY